MHEWWDASTAPGVCLEVKPNLWPSIVVPDWLSIAIMGSNTVRLAITEGRANTQTIRVLREFCLLARINNIYFTSVHHLTQMNSIYLYVLMNYCTKDDRLLLHDMIQDSWRDIFTWNQLKFWLLFGMTVVAARVSSRWNGWVRAVFPVLASNNLQCKSPQDRILDVESPWINLNEWINSLIFNLSVKPTDFELCIFYNILLQEPRPKIVRKHSVLLLLPWRPCVMCSTCYEIVVQWFQTSLATGHKLEHPPSVC